MMTLLILAGLAYVAIGCGVALLSRHELATSGRVRRSNRLMALGAALFWLPTLLVLIATAIVMAVRPVSPRIEAPVRVGASRHTGGCPTERA